MKRLILTMPVLSFLTACSHLVSLSEIDYAEAKWRGHAIQNYDFSVVVNSLALNTPCSPGTRIDVEVRNARLVKSGTCAANVKMAQELGTVPQMFATIRSERAERPPAYMVRFNSALGYPEKIYANYSRVMTDSSVRYYIENFREIKSAATS